MTLTEHEIQEELNVLHTAVMALETILIKKGLLGIDELNMTIRECAEACETARQKGLRPKFVP